MNFFKTISLILIFIGPLAAKADSLASDDFIKLDRIVYDVYQELEDNGVILDNGYYTSSLLISDTQLSFSESIKENNDLISHVEKTMFTIFAYANLSDVQKYNASKILVERLSKQFPKKKVVFYKQVNSSDSSVEIMSSCNIWGPKETLYVGFEGQDNAVLALKSDVCD